MGAGDVLGVDRGEVGAEPEHREDEDEADAEERDDAEKHEVLGDGLEDVGEDVDLGD